MKAPFQKELRNCIDAVFFFLRNMVLASCNWLGTIKEFVQMYLLNCLADRY